MENSCAARKGCIGTGVRIIIIPDGVDRKFIQEHN